MRLLMSPSLRSARRLLVGTIAAMFAVLTVVPGAQAALTPAPYTYQVQVQNLGDCSVDSYVGLDMPTGTAGLTNAGFETGNMAGWSGDGSVTTSAFGLSAPYGSYFALVQGYGCDARTLNQTFAAGEGTTIEGQAFFKTSDYAPYTDYGRVRLVADNASGPPIVLFESDVCDVGNYGNSGWMQFRYTFTDSNNDGHPDPGPAVSPPGSGCNTDADFDGVPNTQDNCPKTSNPNQQDSDFDGIGDACDPTPFPVVTDTDGDGVADTTDNCKTVANANQADADGDGQGDACDSDDDNDGVADTSDNCQFVSNADQANNDGDAQGDACDADDDNDSVNDGSDNCQFAANADQANNDGDAQGDACDADDDNDGVADNAPDNCQFVANPGQQDADGDGVGTACDPTELPKNKDECKNDGWKKFHDGTAVFKNQGDCVSFVATGGKNLPAGRA